MSLPVAVVEQHIDTATVLFTDVVGSTSMRARIGEEAAEELRVSHDELVNDAIVAKRGTVVKHTGDGVMATFSAAVDAVAAAVAIQQAVDRHNRRAATERLAVRVGISVGDVSFDGLDCFGLPVIEAQRLEAAAEGGQILCAELVQHLARGRGGHDFASMGDLELKGIPEPVPTVEVRWEPAVQTAMPREMRLPATLSSPVGFDLAGRAIEFDNLIDAWKDAATGRGRVVLLSGEPGIGKTRLATETALVARQQGGLVLAGRCDEELEMPYQPFVEALRFQIDLGDELPIGWLGPLAGELTRLVPELSEHLAGLSPRLSSDPESERARLFDAVTAWLHTTAASVPVMLVLDDLHWADRPTLQLLRHLVRETPNDALLIVGTYRSTDLDRAHPLAATLADLRREGSVTRVALDGLTGDGVAELLGGAAGHELDEAGLGLAQAVSTETGGNPYFVGEIVRHLVESGALIQRDGRWTSELTLDEIGLPEGVREVVGRRVSRLDPDTQRLLSVAAVIGYEFPLAVLAAVAETGEDAAIDLLDAALGAGLVIEVGLDRYRFGHALLRATLLEELSTSRRVRTHRKIAETIETRHAGDLDSVVTELAYHYGEAAAAGVADKAVRYAARAGDMANAASAPDDAARWFALALEYLELERGDVAVEVDLLTRLGTAQWYSGVGQPTETLRRAAQKARGAGLYVAMAQALLVSGRTSFDSGQQNDPVKIEMLDQVLEHLDDEPALRARAMAALAVELIFVGDVERRTALIDEAVVLARAAGDPLALVDVTRCRFNARQRSTWGRDSFTWESELSREALAAAEVLDDPVWLTGSLSGQAFSALILGDREALLAAAARLDRLAIERQHPLTARSLLFIAQHIAAVDGRLAEAEALSAEMYQSWHAAGIPEAVTYRSTQRFAVRREQGRLAEIVPVFRAFVEALPDAAVARSMLAFALAETGDLDEAGALFDLSAAAGFGDIPDDASWPMGIAMAAEVAAIVGDRQAAAMLREMLLPFDTFGQFGTGGIMSGPAARMLARLELVLDRPDDADRHFEQGLALSVEFETPLWIARCSLDWAESLADRGDAEAARARLEQAEAAMAPLTLPALEQQATALRARLAP